MTTLPARPTWRGRARTHSGIQAGYMNVTIKSQMKEKPYTYGGAYMRRFIQDVKKKPKGISVWIPIFLLPRNAWEDKDTAPSSHVSKTKTFGLWVKSSNRRTAHVPFIDLNDIGARKFEKFDE